MKKKLYLLLMIVLLFSLSGCGNGVKMTSSSADMVGKNYEIVIQELNEIGLTNIEKVEIADLTSNSPMADGGVESVVIDGNETFDEKSKFTKDSNVVLTYHIVRRLNSPLAADKIATMEIKDIADTYTKSGFTNVKTEEVYDMDPETTSENHRNEVVISGRTVVSETDSFKFDADVRVICHYPYEKYDAKIIVDFIGNLIFNKYDVVLKIDGNVVDTLAHGKDYETTIKLKEGLHEIVFDSAGYENVYGKVNLNVASNVEASYKISAQTNEVNVETIYVDQQYELADDEVKIMGSMSSYKYRDYKVVEKELSDLGFTNITTNPLYDIVFGWTAEGEVGSVIIDGKDGYKRGDVFKKDAEIVISYHMSEEDDPNRKVESDENLQDEEKLSEDEELYTSIYMEVVDHSLVDAKKYLVDMGYNVKLTHEVTQLDFTGELSIYADDELNEQGWVVTGIADFDSTKKTINLYVNTTENMERIAAEKNLEETLEKNFDPAVAMSALELYGKEQYPLGFKLDKITGRLAETAVDENTWFMKYKCEVKDAYGNKQEMTCEGKIQGPESNPTVYDFYVY